MNFKEAIDNRLKRIIMTDEIKSDIISAIKEDTMENQTLLAELVYMLGEDSNLDVEAIEARLVNHTKEALEELKQELRTKFGIFPAGNVYSLLEILETLSQKKVTR